MAPKITLPTVTVPKVALPKVALPKVALPKVALPKVTLPTLPAVDERLTTALRDAAYVTVGIGVLAVRQVDAGVKSAANTVRHTAATTATTATTQIKGLVHSAR
jgi:hypothetical protein